MGQGTITRKVSQFDWSRVEQRLVRRLLIAAYNSEDNGSEAARVGNLSPAELLTNASRVLGRLPSAKLFPSLMDVLREDWLPTLPVESLQELATEVAYGLDAREQPPKGERACLEFLRSRKKAKTLVKLFRSAFLRAHRTTTEKPSDPSEREAQRTLLEISGRGEPPREAWPHQVATWNSLSALGFADSGKLPVSGLVVLPTGAGKTDVAVTWLVRNVLSGKAPKRVLWLAHQQELLEQARQRFELIAAELPKTERFFLRLFSSRGFSIEALADKKTDVALVTIQSFAQAFEVKKLERLHAFLRERPTVIVVDEAHHGGAATYDKVLSAAEKDAVGLLGLTATPYPGSRLARERFKKRFPIQVIKAEVEELVEQRILARQVTTSIQTGVEVELSTDDRNLMERYPDFAPQVLARLNSEKRNALIVDTYRRGRAYLGKTLVFAANIEHADRLTEMFRAKGVPVEVLHSLVRNRRKPLDWFKSQPHEAVLVSVGMLTEGVDLPDAQAVLLARPTMSRILLKQMIGRALRGPLSRGSELAYIVSFQDYWQRFTDVLSPADVLVGPPTEFDPSTGKVSRLPPLLLGNIQVPNDIAAEAERLYRPVSFEPSVLRSALTGWYRLDDRNVPVFEHQRLALKSFLDAAGKDFSHVPLVSFFEDVPDPLPPRRDLEDLRAFVEENGELPDLVSVDDSSTPLAVARKIRGAGALDDDARAQLIAAAYQGGVSRLVYPSRGAFEQAVDSELRALRNPRQAYDGRISLIGTSPSGRPLLPRAERSLAPLVEGVREWAHQNLPDHRDRIQSLPEVQWSSNVVESYFGLWTFRRSGKAAGRATITINTLLQARRSIVSDEAIQFVIFHEFLHHLLPFRGHDEGFRELEARWPGAAAIEAGLHALADNYEMNAPRYRAEGKA